jgi:GDP-L-fucose synthase
MSRVSKSDKILITGHRGLLGSAIQAELKSAGYTDVVTIARKDLDLTEQNSTYDFLKTLKPKAVIHCAALVGGIHANSARPADFLYDNVSMQSNVIQGSFRAGVENLMFFGSNCMYPTGPTHPMSEDMLMSGPPESSNLAYAIAKNAGFVQCQSLFKQHGSNYFTVVPASLYGPNDNFNLEQCHVTPALILRFHQAKKAGDKTFSVWGTGKPRRELLFSEDAARGIRLILENWEASMGPVNLGAGDDLSVREIAESIQNVVGFKGDLAFDTTKPDGNPRKLLDSSKVQKLGFKAQIGLEQGLKKTYDWLLSRTAVRGVREGDL